VFPLSRIFFFGVKIDPALREVKHFMQLGTATGIIPQKSARRAIGVMRSTAAGLRVQIAETVPGRREGAVGGAPSINPNRSQDRDPDKAMGRIRHRHAASCAGACQEILG
jgi:hypothetical protein